MLLGVQRTSGYFSPHPDIDGAYMLDTPKGKVAITFRRSVLDTFAPDVRLLTYGTEELEGLLAAVGTANGPAEAQPATLSDLERGLAASRD